MSDAVELFFGAEMTFSAERTAIRSFLGLRRRGGGETDESRASFATDGF
jgi:hypothetical protein